MFSFEQIIENIREKLKISEKPLSDEEIEKIDSVYDQVYEEYNKQKNKSDKWLAVLLNMAVESVKGTDFIWDIERDLSNYVGEERVKRRETNKRLGKTREYTVAQKSVWSNQAYGEMEVDDILTGFEYNSDGKRKLSINVIDYLGLLESASRRKWYSGFSEDSQEKWAKKFKLTMREYREAVKEMLPVLEEFYSVTRGEHKDPHRANEIRKEFPKIAKMAESFDEYLKESIRTEELRGKIAGIELSVFKAQKDDGTLKPQNIKYAEGPDVNIEIADLLFSPREVTVRRIAELGNEISFRTPLERSVVMDGKQIETLDIEEMELPLIKKQLSTAALSGYMLSTDGLKRGIKETCKIMGRSPKALEINPNELPIFTKTEISTGTLKEIEQKEDGTKFIEQKEDNQIEK